MFGFLKKPVADLFIARPEGAVSQLVYRWPDQSIPNGAKLTVRADEAALFFKQGVLVGQLEAGAHTIESKHLPFLGDLVVSPMTNDNHYLTELFFVRRTEVPYALGPVNLGKFQDISSRLMVTLQYAASFTVRVTSAEQLVTRLVGMSSNVMGDLAGFLEGRIRSMLAQTVGRLVASEPILQITSNQYSEEIGQSVMERTRTEFASDGIEVTRFLSLDLRLDPSSEAELRAFGGKLADLSVQREQADVATQPGFAAYNLVKGQADLMRGVATGAAVHGLPAMGGIGGVGLGGAALGAALSSGGSSPSNFHPPPPAARLTGGASMKFYLRGPGGVEGPYPARQVALRAVSLRLQPDGVFVRPPGSTDWLVATDVPEIAAEIEKRQAKAPPTSTRDVPMAATSPTDVFERALAVAVADKEITTDELELLGTLALAANLGAESEAARAYVVTRARALGCTFPSATPAAPPPGAPPPAAPPPAAEVGSPASPSSGGPPPLRVGTVYIYDNGVQRTEGLSAKAVASRVKAAPDGVHMVWWNGAPDWTPADEVEAIKALL